MNALLSGEGITKHFAGVTALSGFSFEVPSGAITGVIGPNGSGKTTLMNIITGLYRADRGDLFFDGRNITGLPPHRIAALGIARSFQNIRLFSDQTILENVLLGTHLHRQAGIADILLRLPRLRREERAAESFCRELLERFELKHLAEHPVGRLSYGDRRRVEIVRALALRPRLLLLDEPAAGMNATEKLRLAGLIRRIRDERISILLIDHDMEMVMRLCDSVTVLNFGKKLASGLPCEIQGNPAVREAYLGLES
ncbi:MAG: ABC transporter ATP-binding protein [Desulfovibrio sp.]|jgi:branched-chain amino acid transport system ATP-binding protein|nr:ABC transporter ATP-binding protein [Desulfovibrio sp.]